MGSTRQRDPSTQVGVGFGPRRLGRNLNNNAAILKEILEREEETCLVIKEAPPLPPYPRSISLRVKRTVDV